jgi:hypothetical protein
MFNSMWKGIFLCVILLIGDPFVNLKAQVPVDEVAHNTPKTCVYVL